MFHLMKKLMLSTVAIADEEAILAEQPTPEDRMELQCIGKAWASFCVSVRDRGRSNLN
ncbi:hypothetical protein LEM8419_03572 [Neolewinella maritima]|uniref:Uncharacterized protein n=2 Tax=Neolewinella maritima TaxID=1383882 RepID=A0ABM9B5N7_9BACT|nr:hypothetical protein LEM8419_03572 [Neolewinella maritima]